MLTKDQIVAVFYLLQYNTWRDKAWLFGTSRILPGIASGWGGVHVQSLRAPILVGAPTILGGLLLSCLPKNGWSIGISSGFMLVGMFLSYIEMRVMARTEWRDYAGRYQTAAITRERFEEVLIAARSLYRLGVRQADSQEVLRALSADEITSRETHMMGLALLDNPPAKKLPAEWFDKYRSNSHANAD